MLLFFASCDENGWSEDDAGSGSGGNAPDGGFELPRDGTPWTERTFDYDCQHVEVQERCKDGWCLIPAGCFIVGSPEDEPGRGLTVENQVPVELTHALAMMQTETTQKYWSRQAFPGTNDRVLRL